MFWGGGLSGDAPLILTLALDEAHQAIFDRLRRAHFPPDRNVLTAHVTLFHALPGIEEPAIVARLREIAAMTPPPVVAVEPPYPLGRGVAYRLVSPDVDALRSRLAGEWRDRLSPQDRTKTRLHVTVQNKVAPDEARALHAALLGAFAPSRFRSPGLALHRYRGGPWEPAASFAFAG